jgi:hypothetical protein
MLFDSNRSGLDKRMFMMFIFPVSFVAVPIPLVMAMPIFVIPIVVLRSSSALAGSELPTTVVMARRVRNNVFISICETLDPSQAIQGPL